MEVTIEQALQQGIAAHQAGKVQDAEKLYRAILQSQPKHPEANHNLGVLAVSFNKADAALPLFKTALEANPKIEQFWLSYIDASIKAQQFDTAIRVLEQAKKQGVVGEKLAALEAQLASINEQGTVGSVSPSREQLNSLLEYYQTGCLNDAEKLALSFTQEFPKHQFGWKVLGAVLQATGRTSEAIGVNQTAVALLPQDAEARNNLGNMLNELGRLEESEVSCAKAIALKPDFAEAHNNLGVTLQELGRLEESEASLRQAITLKPDLAKAYSNLGVTLKELGRLDETETSYRQAIALQPDYADAHYNLGNTVKALGRLDEAEASYRQAITLKREFTEAFYNLGNTLRELGRLDEAEGSYKQAIALNPDFAEAHRNLTTTKNFLSEDEQFSQMYALYRDSATSKKSLCHICFALAKAYEDLRDFARAFQLYAEANALRKKELGYDNAQDKQLFERLKANYQQIRDAVAPEIAAPEHSPIFIVGMLRSGTTLVEQIVSSHPLVTGAGELSFVHQFGGSIAVGQTPVDSEALTTFREEYLSALKQRSGGKASVTDKMPQNFRFLGLIARALPESKIIHVKRDPAAVCWANYTQYFVSDSLGYCYGLEDILHYHRLYEDLMKYWHQALPNRIYDLDYEALTERQEEETRKLIAHLGLEWDDACLSPEKNARGVATASNVQIRRKVYQGSSERWRRFRPFLHGALDHLSAGNQ